MFTHLFKKDGVTHVVLTSRERLKRKRTLLAICATNLFESKRLSTFGIDDERRHDITCDRCLRTFTGFVDVIETDFGFESKDDGTGRFQ